MDDKDREIQKTREYNYLLWTIIVVLAIMLVNLFAQQTCNNEAFVSQVSFASTLTSIILSVIAIIMTVVSNDTIGLLLHRFRDLHDDIKEVPEQLRKTVKDFNQSCEDLKGIEKNLNILPNELKQTKQHIETLTKLLNESVEKLGSIDERTSRVDKTLNELNDNLSPNALKKETSSSNRNVKLDENDIKKIISYLPTRAKLTLYTIVNIVKESKVFDVYAFSKDVENDDIGYPSGVFVTLRAFGLLKYSYPQKIGDKLIIKFSDINDVVLKSIDLFTPSYDNRDILKEVKKFIDNSMSIEEYDKEFEKQ